MGRERQVGKRTEAAVQVQPRKGSDAVDQDQT